MLWTVMAQIAAMPAAEAGNAASAAVQPGMGGEHLRGGMTEQWGGAFLGGLCGLRRGISQVGRDAPQLRLRVVEPFLCRLR